MAKKIRFLTPVLVLLLSLIGSIMPNPAIATPDAAEWSTVDIPTDGETGKWVLADGSDVRHLAVAIDDTIYAYATH